MKTIVTALAAGAVLASASLVLANDQWAEAHFRAKIGRYTPAQEARRQALAHNAQPCGETCGNLGCCRGRHAPAAAGEAATASNWAAEIFSVKTGRTTAVSVSDTAERHVARVRTPVSQDAWMQAKWGRSVPQPAGMDSRIPHRAGAPLAAANLCNRPCCN